jgi:hypothetical protein
MRVVGLRRRRRDAAVHIAKRLCYCKLARKRGIVYTRCIVQSKQILHDKALHIGKTYLYAVV